MNATISLKVIDTVI